MAGLVKQHLIDPEICIRCHTCEEACPIDAITHDDSNVVIDAEKCDFCMACIPPCPTGSIDNWRVVRLPYSLDDQFGWDELPAQEDVDDATAGDTSIEAIDDSVAALLAEAHTGVGGPSKPPASASKPSVNLYTLQQPATAVMQGNYRLTAETGDSDVRHIILSFGDQPFPVLEGQCVGIIAPGTDAAGRPHRPRLYSVASPRDGERPNTNNIALTVKREPAGVCSTHLCDLEKGGTVAVTGPFGASFLMPNDPQARLLMICTGTGAAPFRGMTMRRQRETPELKHSLMLVFGARTPDDLPYFGPLAKVPDDFIAKHFAFSRLPGQPKHYVQDQLRDQHDRVAALLQDPDAYIYVCGLRAMEPGVEAALADIARVAGLEWTAIRERMRDEGRYHMETY